MTDQFERVDLEAELLAHLGHGVDVAGATCTEVEVLTDDDRPGVQRLDKDLLHEHVRGVAARSSSKEIRYTQSMPCASISSSFWSSVVSSFARSPDGPHGPGGRRRSQPPNARRAGRRRLGPAGRPPGDPGAHRRKRRSCRDGGIVGQSITAVVQEFHGASGSGDLEKRYRGITTVGFPPWGCDSYTARSTPSSPSTVHGPTPETPNCSSGRTRPWPTSTAVSSSTMADSRC